MTMRWKIPRNLFADKLNLSSLVQLRSGSRVPVLRSTQQTPERDTKRMHQVQTDVESIHACSAIRMSII
jgi:hypothetical protein